MHLQPDESYYVVVEADPGSATDGAEGVGRDSLAFELSACHPDAFFCAVSNEHWAQPEIQQWHDLGITNGCRSGTAPYQDRPFCPDTVVNRDMFAVLLLRQLLGGDFQPPPEYRGSFGDVAEDARFVQWIEALDDHGLALPMTNCIAGEGFSRFCPNMAMTRGDLAPVLADVLAWELDGVESLSIADVPPDDPAASAINYLRAKTIVKGQDPHCPQAGAQPRFCPDSPLTRDSAAFLMTRASDDPTGR